MRTTLAALCLSIAIVTSFDHRKSHAQIDESEPALSVAFSNCNCFQAVGFVDGRVEVVDLKEKRIAHELHLGRYESAWALEFSPAGNVLAAGGGWPGVGGVIKIFSLTNMKAEVVASIAVDDQVRDLSFSSDGNLLASGGEDKLVRLWDAASGRSLATFAGHEGATTSVDFASDGRTIFSTGYDGFVRQWIVGRREPVREFQTASRPLVGVVHSTIDDTIYCCSVVQGVSQWTREGKRMRSLPIPEGIGGCHTVTFNPAQKQVVGLTSQDYLLVWDRASGELEKVTELKGSPRTLCISPDGRLLGLACRSIDDRWIELKELDLAR